MSNKNFWCFRFILTVLGLIPMSLFFLLMTSCDIFSSGSDSETVSAAEVEFEIKEGMTLKEVSSILEEKGIIDSAFLFRLFVEQRGKEGSLIPGVYTLRTGSEFEDVLNEITTGPQIISYKFTIPEGYIAEQIAVRVSEEIPFVDYEDMKSAMDIGSYNYGFLAGASSLEGFLFPKTYEITVDYDAADIINMMLAQYQYETGSLDYALAESKGMSPYDILIIASMIEREAYIPEERVLISAVIHNRLEIDMKLYIDATLSYFLDKWGEDESLTESDLETDTEYNTSLYAGLPPTPICNPGLECIKAALDPADVGYLFFKITDTENHIHSFFEDYQDFINAEVN
jgi:UPF0755 protein